MNNLVQGIMIEDPRNLSHIEPQIPPYSQLKTIIRIGQTLWMVRVLIPVVIVVFFLRRRKQRKNLPYLLTVILILVFVATFLLEFVLFGDISLQRPTQLVHPYLVD